MSQTVVIAKSGPGFLVRALWFIFIGWWATGLVTVIAWIALVTVVGIPLFAWLINRVPAVLTLEQRTKRWTATAEGGVTVMREAHATQRPLWQRALYLVLVGWWFSALWMGAAWLLCVVIVGLPLGIWMYNRTPLVTTLMRY